MEAKKPQRAIASKPRPDSENPDTDLSVSLRRGLAILSAFGAHRQPLGISELAALLDMNTSTVHRYVKTLTRLGYLQQEPVTKKYRLDMKVVDLGLAVINSLDIRDVARPHLQQLCQKLGLTVNMAVLDATDIVYVERIRGQKSIDLNDLHVGSRQPAYCTSMGKVLLSALDESRLNDLLRLTEFIHRGPNTITNPEYLKAELDTVRRLGFAVNNEEFVSGLRSVAAPLRDPNETTIAAINLNAALFSLQETMDSLVPELLTTAHAISRDLGAAHSLRIPTTSDWRT
jgi:IclR family pca regulon transcriptional regulator